MHPLPDSRLKASSSFNSLNGPQSARLNSAETGITGDGILMNYIVIAGQI